MACEKAYLPYGTPRELFEHKRITKGWRFLAEQVSSILHQIE